MSDSRDKLLPEGWKWTKLSEIAKLYVGSSAPQNKKYFSADGLPFYRVSDVSKYGRTKNLIDSVDHISKVALNELKLVSVKAGTIVFPKSGGAVKTNNRAIIEKDGFLVSHLMAVEAYQDVVEKKWLYWYFCQIDLMKYSDNDQYPSLKQSVVEKLDIPLPPLPEQKRIVAILTEQLSAVEKAKKASEARLEAARALPIAYLREVFESNDAKKWKKVKFDDFILDARNGFGKRPNGDEQGPIVLRLADVSTGAINLSDPRRVSMTNSERQIYKLENGNILFVRVNGSSDYIARCIVVDKNYDDVSYNDHLIRVILPPEINPYFLQFFSKTDSSREYFISSASKKGVTSKKGVKS